MPAAQIEMALMLHVRPYRETSAIVQMFTQGQGRLTGVLRGYRGKKQGQSSIQPFNLGTMSWVGRSELVTIQKFESHHFIALQGEALYAGFYVLELLTRLLREKGALAGCILAADTAATVEGEQHALQAARAFAGLSGMDLAKEVTGVQRRWTQTSWTLDGGYGELEHTEFKVVAYDFGVKRNILRLLASKAVSYTHLTLPTNREV